jgi:hypothetical protein
MKFFSILFTLIFALTISFGQQVPQKLSYQAVVRDANNNLVINKEIGIQVTILKGNENKTEIYKEKFSPNPITNSNGLFTISIGSGVPITGTFNKINWNRNYFSPYYIKTEIDPNGGTNYSITGISEIMSVPYALASKSINFPYRDSVDTDGAGFFLKNTSEVGTTIAVSGHTAISGEARNDPRATNASVAIKGRAFDKYDYSGYFVGGKFFTGSDVNIGTTSFNIKMIKEIYGKTNSNGYSTIKKLPENFNSLNTRVLSIEFNTSENTWYGGTSYTAGSGEVTYALKNDEITIYVEPNSSFLGKNFRILLLMTENYH